MMAPGPIIFIMFLKPLAGASGTSFTFQAGNAPALMVSFIFSAIISSSLQE
jgi:hypothetical protein